MLLSETWLDQNTDSDLIAIPGYFLFRQDRVGRGGGVAAHVKVDLHCSVIDINLTSITGDLEFLLLRVKYQTYSCIIGVFYRPPSSRLQNNIDTVNGILSLTLHTADLSFLRVILTLICLILIIRC
nr:unnamed protein product [Callosobruchus chinensis]